jgi:hypothetical protein
LDASNDPQGNYQHVLVETDGLANPNGPVVDTINNCSADLDQCELAWIQTRFDTEQAITPDGGGGLVLLTTSPQTANNTETVTTGSSFNIGYNQAEGVFGSYTYSNSVTRTISDWIAVNESNNAGAQWVYASQNQGGGPTYNGLITEGYDPSAWDFYVDGVAPRTPNNLSVADLEYTMQSYWTNNQVSEDWISIGGTDSAWYTDAWVIQSVLDQDPVDAPHCIDTCNVIQHMARFNASGEDGTINPWSLQVNLATVIPVPTKSLTLNPNPVVAGQPTTATLTLASATPLPAVLLISSDKAGIAPEHDTYTIPAGQDSLNFVVNTGAQGCEPQSATISAYYAEGQNAVLSVNPPPNCQ